jgi:hypothetical protein
MYNQRTVHNAQIPQQKHIMKIDTIPGLGSRVWKVAAALALCLGLLSLRSFGFSDYADIYDEAYVTGTVYNVPSGTFVEWVNEGNGGYGGEIGVSGCGLNIFQYGSGFEGYTNTTESGTIDYTLRAYSYGEPSTYCETYLYIGV